MKKQILNLSVVLFTSILVSCGGKKDGESTANEETTASVNAVKEEQKVVSVNEKAQEKAEENKVEDVISDADIKKANDLIDGYEQTIKEIEFFNNNPPMNPAAAVSKLEAFESAIKSAVAKINAAKMTDEQKARFEKAKAKCKKLGY